MTLLKAHNPETNTWEPVAAGSKGADGTDGAPGPQGPAGLGVPVGGTTGQALVKKTNSDNDTEWATPASVSDWGDITGALSDQTDLQSALDEKMESPTTDTLTVSDTAPATPAVGDVWLDTSELPEELAPSSIVWKEVPTGTKNGSNDTFTTAQPYVSGSLNVFVNGLAEGSQVNETGAGSGQFTITPAPLSTDNLNVQYQIRTVSTGNADTVDNYHASQTPAANTIPVLDANAKIPNSALFTGASGVQSSANTGTAGGTMNYANIGGIKMLWGITAAFVNSTAGAQRSVIYPSGFFTSVQSVTASIYDLNTHSQQSANIIGPSNSQMNIIVYAPVTTTNEYASYFVIGV